MCYSAMVKRDLEYLGKTFGATWVREQLDDYLSAVAENPKRFPPLQDRIFPGHYAPVIYPDSISGQRRITLMRYGAYPPPNIKHPGRYTTFNARRDNLTSIFWSTAFMRNHGFVVLSGFYEWVAVKDLLNAGVVSLGDVRKEFERQAEERRAKILAAGKKYKPTATEQKDARLRKIIIEFQPEDGSDLLVPVIFSSAKLEDGRKDLGFAIITDEPPSEIAEAGHDRCPVILSVDAIDDWLAFKGKTVKQLDDLLANKQRVTFKHRLPNAA